MILTIQRLVKNLVTVVLLYKQAWMLAQSEGNYAQGFQIIMKLRN